MFSSVFQDIHLLPVKISEFVSAVPAGKSDSALVDKSLEMAGLKDKISSLKDGADTPMMKDVVQNATEFSGGEKQKLALARALYKNAPIVVLDEPTSALDAIAEQRLYQSFDKMIGKKSAVYISHRLASTRFCDNVAMFKSGEMIEYGTHESLMEKKGEYARMFELQAQYYQKEEDVNE